MTRLSDTQLILLSAAANREDGRIILPDRLRGGAADAVLGTLRNKGLIEPIEDDRDGDRRSVRERDPQCTHYRINRSGLLAIHAGDDEDATGAKDSQGATRGSARAGLADAGNISSPAKSQPGTGLADRPAADTTGSSRRPRRKRADRGISSAALRQSTRPVSDCPSPRNGSKLATLADGLARATGASIGELTSATGWLPHTVRAAISRLRHRGISVERFDVGSQRRYRLEQHAGGGGNAARGPAERDDWQRTSLPDGPNDLKADSVPLPPETGTGSFDDGAAGSPMSRIIKGALGRWAGRDKGQVHGTNVPDATEDNSTSRSEW